MELELEEVLALLDEAPCASRNSQELQVLPSENAEFCWQWGIPDDNIGDLRGQEGTSDHKPKKKRRKKLNPNKARDDRRLRLIKLNDEVVQLEFTLKKLRTIQGERRDQFGNCHFPEQDGRVPRVWQDICTRQLARRLTTELENARLKRQFEKEKHLAKSFERLLYKRQASSYADPETTKHTRRTDIPAGHIERMAALISNELVAGVRVCYCNVENVFESSIPENMNSVRHNAVLDGGKKIKGTERRLYDRRTMPFDIHATGEVWWENWHNYRGQRFEDVAADELRERFGLEMGDVKSNTSATAYAQQVSQRYIEDDRIVFVWDAYIEPFGFKNERVGGVYFLEQTYILLQPEEHHSDSDRCNQNTVLTRVSNCIVITPHFLDPELVEDTKTAALIDFLHVVSSLTSNIIALSETTETLLLDQALQRCTEV